MAPFWWGQTSGCSRPLVLGKLREIPVDDGLAETLLEHFLLAVHLVGAAGLEVFPAQAPADAHGHIGAIAALLPRPQRDQRRDLLGSFLSHLRDGDFRQ